MKPLSLRSRLLLVATLVLLLFLGLMGVVLDQAFRRSAEQGVSERLLLHIYGLLATTEETLDGEVFLPEVLQEPDFNRLGTGLYAIVLDASDDELWRSESALDISLAASAVSSIAHDLPPGEPRFGSVMSQAGEPLFFLSYRVLWQGSGDAVTPFTYVTLQTLDTYRGEVTGFRNNLWGWLVAVIVALVLVQAAVMSWGLSPLRRLASDLKRIEDGEQDYLQGGYPEEIEGVTRNLNLLLSAERQQREKYRTTLADLAHSLKTPLAILKGTASSMEHGASVESTRATVDEQVSRMDDIVSYQLGKAVTSSPGIIRRSIAVEPILERLVAAMKKVYAHRDLDISLSASEGDFFGDERDLMELLGNVVDNACKYGRHQVKISSEQATGREQLRVVIEDDGPGIPESDRLLVLERGARLDTVAPGQGIGLAVVKDIVDRYGGQITIDGSSLGGARFEILLP